MLDGAGGFRAGHAAGGIVMDQPGGFRPGRVPLLAWVIGAGFVVVELAVSGRYGFLQDELYFLVAGHHLAFGYVDQPPLAPLLTRITGILGVSPTAIRIIPALAGGAVVIMAARLAALFGAGRLGRVLAALHHGVRSGPPRRLAHRQHHAAGPARLDGRPAVRTTALLRHSPRWWLAAGAAAGLGLEADNLVALLLICLAVGLLASPQRPVLRTWWPWLSAGIAVVIWAPNLIWQATHGWPQLAMSAALHQQNTSPADYAGALPAQLLYLGLLGAPAVLAAGRWISSSSTCWPGYRARCTTPMEWHRRCWPRGALAAERWIARARRPRVRQGLVVGASLAGVAVALPSVLPVLPVSDVHDLPASAQQSSLGDTIGWPQLTSAVAVQDVALARAGQPPTSIFAGYYAEAGALDLLGSADHLPPVLSGHNGYWMWGPGRASDRTVLVGRRGRPVAAVLRQLPTAHHRGRFVPRAQ
jgi:hypothetical protein